MERLTKHITDRILSKKFCTVFEQEISRIWPLCQKAIQKRNEAIHAFAKERGFSALILDPGVRVSFKKLPASD